MIHWLASKNEKKINFTLDGSTPIEREQTTFKIGKHSTVELLKTQFPLNLAFAYTIHKTQGITTYKIVGSFDGPLSPGQAYVALSRCKDIDGLFLTSFDKTKMKTN